jgi:hypothetical protein
MEYNHPIMKVQNLILEFTQRLVSSSKKLGEYLHGIYIKIRQYYALTPCTFLVLGTYWYFCIPTPGKSVAVLGVVAALMSLINGPKRFERLLWFCALALLVIVEFKAINKDKIDSAAAQQKFMETQKQSFMTITSQAETNFKSTDTNLQSSISQLDEINKLTQKGVRDTEQTLTNLKGGDSFATIVPQVDAANENEIPLVIVNRGEYTLTGITLKIIDMNYHFATGNAAEDIKHQIYEDVGTLHNGEAKFLKYSIPLNMPGLINREPGGIRDLWISVYSQNFTVTESIILKRNSKKSRWIYAYSVTKNELKRCPTEEARKANKNKPCKMHKELERQEFVDN